MISRLMKYDPVTKSASRFHHTLGETAAVLEVVQDIEPIMELNRAQRVQVDERARWKGNITQVARIPDVVVQELEKQGIWQDEDRLADWLDDKANEGFRTRPGRIGRRRLSR